MTQRKGRKITELIQSCGSLEAISGKQFENRISQIQKSPQNSPVEAHSQIFGITAGLYGLSFGKDFGSEGLRDDNLRQPLHQEIYLIQFLQFRTADLTRLKMA